MNNGYFREAILTNIQNVYFTKEKHGTFNEKIYDPLIFVQPNWSYKDFAVITNVSLYLV